MHRHTRDSIRARRYLPATAMLLALTACTISHGTEIQMGNDYAAELNKKLAIVQNPEINRYLTLLGDSIARRADTRGLDWHFYLVNASEPNAFAVPGGHVYVTRGLIERTKTMSQLAGAMGHEIAHVVRRHSVKELERAQNANVGLTVACVLTGVCENAVVQAGVEVGGAAVFANYSREDEQQADDDAVTNVVRAGISPRGIPELFAALLAERKTRPQGVAAWFATHPTEESRITRTEKAIAAVQPSVLAALTTDTRAFQAFRARVMKLPVVATASVGGAPGNLPAFAY